MHFRIFLILMLTIHPFELFSQSDSLDQKIIKATMAFRNAIIQQTSEDIEDLRVLSSRWHKIEPDTDIVNFLFFNAAFLMEAGYNPVVSPKIGMKRNFPNSMLTHSIQKQDIGVINRNIDLIYFIQHGYLNNTYPYQVQLDSFNIKELEFLEIKKNEQIADIGSGSGCHILLASLLYPTNNFILNEINKSLVEALESRIDRYHDLLNLKERTIQVVKGSKKNLNLPIKVDKIIVRNSFHHFSQKEEMLKSFKYYLKEKGTIIFIEFLSTDQVSTKDSCKDKMREEEILGFISQANLKISKMEVMNDLLFVKCTL